MIASTVFKHGEIFGDQKGALHMNGYPKITYVNIRPFCGVVGNVFQHKITLPSWFEVENTFPLQ